MPVPKLPAALVAVLGTLAGVLALVAPSLPSPWPAIVGGIVAALSLLVGAPVVNAAVRAHGVATAHAARAELSPPTFTQPTRPPADAGSVVVVGAVVMLAAASLGLGAIGLAAHRHAAPDFIGITCAAVTPAGSIDVSYDQQRVTAGKTWAALPDDGYEVAQVHEVGARYGTSGEWVNVGVAHGEGHWRIPALPPQVDADQIRIVRTRTGVTSAAYPIGGCAA